MELAVIAIVFLTVLVAGYGAYGTFLSRTIFAIDKRRITPAHAQADNLEFVPTRPFYLFCQHFSAIAASGPIAGPILACQKWGYVPCLLWISLGAIFIGSVHDFSALAASVRHRGCSIAEICRERMGPKAGQFLLVFIWLALIYVIVAFTQVTAATFVVKSEELEGIDTSFHPGGAVLASALYYLVICLLMGVLEKWLKPPLWLSTLIFVPAIGLTIYLGMHTSAYFIFNQLEVELGILAYCALASVTPVWLLLQPRGYLGGIVLLLVLLIGIFGIFFGGFTIKHAAFISDSEAGIGHLLPFLFVTIACGACSGFHGLVCCGTTSKQVDNETHIQPIGYGAMLMESLVAFIALSTVMIFSSGAITGLKPGTIYGKGIGEYLTLIVGPEHRSLAITFGAMAFSTFVFDTLDVATRLGRYLLQEFFGIKEHQRVWATLMTLGIPAMILVVAPKDSWVAFWTLFGSANQLLAALTLLTITIWLKQSGRPIIYTLVPMVLVLGITLWSLLAISFGILSADTISLVDAISLCAAILMIVLALYIVLNSFRASPSLTVKPANFKNMAKRQSKT